MAAWSRTQIRVRDIVTSKIRAWFSLQSVVNLSASVDRIAPFLKENQQLHDADDA